MDMETTKTNPPLEKLFLLWSSIQRILPDLTAEDSKQDHENRIRRLYSQLLSNLNVPDVVTQMFQNGKLTPKEHEHLRQFHSTPIRATEELLSFVIINSKDVYECFLESLKKTKQYHLYQMLTSDEESVCIDEQSVSEHSRIIRQNYDWLTEKLDPDLGLLRTLFAREVLSHREHVQIISEMDQFVKNEILLSIISRKSSEDFKKFIIALTDNSQGHLTKRLTETPVGDANKNVVPTVEKIIPSPCFESTGKRIPPKPPPEPNEQPPALPSSKPTVITPKPLLEEPKIHPSKPDRIEKRQNFAKHEMAKKLSVEFLEEKFKKLPNELQTEVSTKIFLIHQSKSPDIIGMISFTKILEESRNIKKHNLMQAKAADENCVKLKQELVHSESECKRIKEDIQREKTKTTTQLREMQQSICELQKKLDRTQNENKRLFEKLKNSEVEVEKLKVLNKQKKQEANEKVSIIEKRESHLAYSEIKLKETETQLRDTKDKLTENDTILKETTMKLEETQEMLKETEAKKNEFEEKLSVTEKCIDDLTVMNQQKKQEVYEKARILEKLKNQTVQSEEQLKQMRAQLVSTEEKFKESELTLKTITTKLEKTEQKLKETETKLKESEAKLKLTEKGNDNLISGGLIATIKTNSAEKGNKLISGLTILDKELFVVSHNSSEVEIYDSMEYRFIRRWNVKELIWPLDIASCNINKCIYIYDYKDGLWWSDIFRVDPNGKLIKKWQTTGDFGRLSVTHESNVILIAPDGNKLSEHSPDGLLIREINLSSEEGFRHLNHAIKLTNGHFVVSHGYDGDDLHRVCVVDTDGQLLKSFGEKAGSIIGRMQVPVSLSIDGNGFVIVADLENSRVLLLNSDLKFQKEILSEVHGLRDPLRILLDQSSGRLVVADNESNNERILVFKL